MRSSRPLERQLYALDDTQARQFLQQRFALCFVRLGGLRGFHKCRDGIEFRALQLDELGALFGVDHGRGDEFGDEMRRSAEPVEILEKVLDCGDREIADDGPQNFDRTGEILRQRVGHSRPAWKFSGAVGEHFRSGAGASERC